MINSIRNKGVQFTFKNGLTISIQFGSENYCSNRNSNVDEMLQRETRSASAEIAIWNKENKWFSFGDDQVKGWVDSDEVGIWIDKVRRAKSIKTIKRIKTV